MLPLYVDMKPAAQKVQSNQSSRATGIPVNIGQIERYGHISLFKIADIIAYYNDWLTAAVRFNISDILPYGDHGFWRIEKLESGKKKSM